MVWWLPPSKWDRSKRNVCRFKFTSPSHSPLQKQSTPAQAVLRPRSSFVVCLRPSTYQRNSSSGTERTTGGVYRCMGQNPNGYGSRFNHKELDRRFESLFPLTRAPFWAPMFDPQLNRTVNIRFNPTTKIGGGQGLKDGPVATVFSYMASTPKILPRGYVPYFPPGGSALGKR